MVRAELNYNPYLLETEVRFNGNPPRINSLVEKYENEKLQTWVSKVPAIFYDEMNGYDFVLDYTGTELDYGELQKAFINAGVRKDQVQLFHKAEIASRYEKVKAIEGLLNWLKENPNRKFDLHEFRASNKELFESAYSFVVIGGSISDNKLFEDIELSIDNVDSSDELRKTDLTSTPVLFYLDRRTVNMLQRNLIELLSRPDINQDQLFFMISPVLGRKVERVIRDLGVKEPNIVETVNDPKIHRYLEIFPVTEFIHDAIIVFRKETEAIGNTLDEENRQSEKTNKDIHNKIKDLEEILSRLKEAYAHFSNKENLELSYGFISAKTNLINGVSGWKIRKTKISNVEEAVVLSSEFETDIRQRFDKFQQEVSQLYTESGKELQSQCDEWYKEADYEEDYRQEDILPAEISEVSLPEIAPELMKIKEEEYVMPKEDFFGKLFRVTQEEIPQDPVLETTFYYEKWRAYAVETLEPIAETILQETLSFLKDYYDRLAKSYSEHINELIHKVDHQKEQVSSQLSEDERLLQIDNDWHTAFCEKLHDIERS